MSRKHLSKGFSAIEAVIIVLVVAAIGLGGWWVLQRKDDPVSKPDSSQTKDDSSDHMADPSEGGEYLVITEWGVRFLLPEEMRGDIYYVIDKNRSDTMVIDSKSFPEGAECVSFGLARTTERVENPTDPEGFNSSSVGRIGAYYYSRITGVIACSNQDEVHNRAASIQRQLYIAAESIDALPQDQ